MKVVGGTAGEQEGPVFDLVVAERVWLMVSQTLRIGAFFHVFYPKDNSIL